MADDRLPLVTFADAAALDRWLDEHGATSPGVWLRFAKKSAAENTVTMSDAIDCALSHGWVDGQLGRVDDDYFRTRFTPRRPMSIWHDWSYLELADPEGDEYADALRYLDQGLLIRRHVADGDLAFFTTWCPADTGIKALIGVEEHRWAIEDSFETAKNELGLDYNETRSQHGWHRHAAWRNGGRTWARTKDPLIKSYHTVVDYID